MAEELSPRRKAARIFRLLSWLQIILCILILVAILIPTISEGRNPVGPLAIGMVFLIIPWLYRKLAAGIDAKREWARTVGIIVGVLMLAGVPIGTLIGGYLLYLLIGGWDA